MQVEAKPIEFFCSFKKNKVIKFVTYYPMKNYLSAGLLLLFCVFIGGSVQGQNSESNNTFMVRHTVVFKLNHPKDSPEEKKFLDEIQKLSAIPGVKKFELLRQVSKKNNYDFGLSMEFESDKAYAAYSNHPDHNAFVQNYWVKEVKDFMEIDYEPYKLKR
jgi:heme-degrading monooxygenase HmoA